MITELILNNVMSYKDAGGRVTNASTLRARDGWFFREEGQTIRARFSGHDLAWEMVFPFSALQRWVSGPEPLPVPREADITLVPKTKTGKKS